MYRGLLSILIFLSVAFSAAGRDSLYHDISVAVSAGYNLPSHGFYRGHNPGNKSIYANTSFHLKYAFGFQPGTHMGSLYPGVTQGVGLAGLTFYEHSLMGTPVIAYIFQNARLFELTDKLGLDYGWELGGSFGWRRNEMISTSANIYVNVGLMLSWDMADCLTLKIGPEFSHYSNGDTRYPNGGANLINFKVGLTGHLTPERGQVDMTVIREYEQQLRNKTFGERIQYDLILLGGFRAGKLTGKSYALINKPFPFFALNFMPSYRLNRHLSVGLSLDLLADRSADLYDVVKNEAGDVVSYGQPDLLRQMAAGLSVRGEITMPIFTVGVGAGGFVLSGGNALRGLYSIFSLKTFLTDHLFLNLSYRLSARNYTHNMMYGLGWRF